MRRPPLQSLARPHSPGTGLCSLILAAGLGLGAALWTWTAPGDPTRFPASAPGVTAHILDNGFHTDLALRRADLIRDGGPLAQALEATPPGDWILIGWGDARFYVDQSPVASRLPDGARAFFAPGNRSVVMLDPTARDPAAVPDARRRTLRLSPAGFAALRARLEDSLALTDGRPVIAAARQGDDARFFASRETFWIGHLCNHWTAELLNAAGLPVRPLRSVTSAEVMAAVDRAATLDTGRPDA